MRILGIDPGLNGAAAIYSTSPRRWSVIDLPTIGSDAQRRINAPALRDWLHDHGPIDHAYIELAMAMPSIPDRHGVRRGMGAATSFRYGRAAGAIEAVVATCCVPISYVTAPSWKKMYGLRGSDKEQSRALALRRFPETSRWLERKLDHQRAEALLIAYFGAAATGAVSSMSPLDIASHP